MATQVRITIEPDGRLCLESPYDPGLVAVLKGDIAYGLREWHPGRKRWLISTLAEATLLRSLQAYGCQIDDARQGAALAADPYALMPDDLRQAFQRLYLAPDAPLLVAEVSYKALARVYHPDNQVYGNLDTMEALNDAIATVRRYLAETTE